jgi:hypothetical protein
VQLFRVTAGRLETALYHRAFVDLENNPLLLEVVEVAGIDTAAVDKAESEIDEQRQRQYNDQREDGNDFGFARHSHNAECLFALFEILN